MNYDYEYKYNYYFTILDCETHEDKKIKCIILSYKTRIINNVTITWKSKYFKKIKVHCDCEETKFLKVCKHIKWLGHNHLNSISPRDWYIDTLEIFKEKNTLFDKTVGKNDECIICFDELKYNTQNTINCKNCNNSIHYLCWNKYNKFNQIYSNICVLCQSNTMPQILY
jgi:hypothetical protein